MKPCLPILLLLVLSGTLAPACAQLATATTSTSKPAGPCLDLTLNQALAQAATGSPDLRLALAAHESALGAIESADNGPNPMLTLQTININPAQGIGNGKLRAKKVDSTVRVDQLIERGDKRALRTRNAQQLATAALADVEDSSRQLRLLVSQAYYDLLAAQEKQRLFDETTTLFQRTTAAARKRRDAGDMAGADVARIDVDLLRASNDSSNARAEVRRAQLALALLMGSSTGETAFADSTLFRAVDSWPVPLDTAVLSAGDGKLNAAIANRADVRAAQARLDAAMTAQRQALALRSRDVSVGVQAEHWPENGGNSYGLSVQIPLFVRNEYNGEIRSAISAVLSARVQLEKTVAGARNDAWRAREDLLVAVDRLQRFQDDLLAAAGKSAQAAEFAFRQGAIGVMDVLDARRVQRSTELDAIAARVEHARALAAWQSVLPTESKP